MTKQELLGLINDYIKTNHNEEITAAVLNSVMHAVVNQINDKVGDLSNLDSSDKTSIISAINEVIHSDESILVDTSISSETGWSSEKIRTELNLLIEGQGIIYDTLAEAQALTPKPVDGTIFQVSEITDPTNAGYYSFQSAEPNGTRFEKSFLSKNELYPAKLKPKNFVELDIALNSSGNKIDPYVGFNTIIDMPLEVGRYELSGYAAGAETANMTVKNSLGESNFVELLGVSPYKFEITDNGYNMLSAVIKTPSDSDSSWDSLSLIVNDFQIEKINDRPLAATNLINDNRTPDPVNPQNAINKKYFDKNALLVSDIKTKDTTNLAKLEYKIDDFLIGANGGKFFAEGWVTYRIPVTSGQDYSFGHFVIDVGGYGAFYNTQDEKNKEGSFGLISNFPYSTAPTGTFTAPINAAWLYLTIARPTNTPTDYETLTINESSTLLPYEDPNVLTEIKSYKIKAQGENYDQSLNTFDDVAFQSISANEITTSVLIAELPEGAGTEPTGLQLHQAWIDTSNGNTIKVKSV